MKHRLAPLALLLALQSSCLAVEGEVRPDEIQFRRKAATRLVFDADQNIPLSSLRPAKVIDLDLMHPELLPDPGVNWEFKGGSLEGTSAQAAGSSLRWAGGFNPFATYDLVVESAKGDGSAGLTFLHSKNGDSLTAGLLFKDGKPESVTWQVLAGGKQVSEEKWPVPAGTTEKDLTLRAQMSAVGVNLFLESEGRSVLNGANLRLICGKFLLDHQ